MSIKIENLSYTYAQGSAYEIHALKNLSLEIHRRESQGSDFLTHVFHMR